MQTPTVLKPGAFHSVLRLLKLRVSLLSLMLAVAVSFCFSATVHAAGSSTDVETSPSVDELMADARSHLKEGNYRRALKLLAKVTGKNKKHADAWTLQGFAQRKLNKPVKSARAYEKALVINPDHKGALAYQGELFLSLEQPDYAQANLQRLNSLCPDGCSELSELQAAIDNGKLTDKWQ